MDSKYVRGSDSSWCSGDEASPAPLATDAVPDFAAVISRLKRGRAFDAGDWTAEALQTINQDKCTQSHTQLFVHYMAVRCAHPSLLRLHRATKAVLANGQEGCRPILMLGVFKKIYSPAVVAWTRHSRWCGTDDKSHYAIHGV